MFANPISGDILDWMRRKRCECGTRGLNRPAVATAGAFVTGAEAKDRTAWQRPSHDCQRHLVGVAHRRSLAGPAAEIRPLAHGGQPVLPMAKAGTVGPAFSRGTATGRCCWTARLGSPLRDGTVVRAHPCCRRKKGGRDQALGRSRGGFGTKVHVRVEGWGKPVAFVLTPGQRHEASVFEELMTRGAVKRPGSGRPRIRPQRVCGDKGYSSRKIRTYLRKRGIRHTIPRKKNERRMGPFDRALFGHATWWNGPSTVSSPEDRHPVREAG